MKKVAIQGIKGSYHHQVATEYFENEIEIIEFLSFDEVANSIVQSHCDFGVMAIENSIAGSIIPNYALIDKLNLNILLTPGRRNGVHSMLLKIKEHAHSHFKN